jgi:hypothetical protein
VDGRDSLIRATTPDLAHQFAIDPSQRAQSSAFSRNVTHLSHRQFRLSPL